jgi:hypothetical protein
MKRIKDLFDIKYGTNLELVNIDECKPSDVNSIPFVSRTEKNNGVSAYVYRIPDIEPNPGHTLSVAGGGSVLSTFYQPIPYYSGRDLYYLTPIEDMSVFEMLYYCNVIKSNKYRYSYGRQANKTLGDLLVPDKDEIPKWVFKNKFPDKPKSAPFHNKQINLNDRDWGFVKLTDIFNRIEKCKCSNASDLLNEGNEINYIGAKKSENGVMNRVLKVNKLVSEGNCIVFIGDGQGSVGYTTYQENDFIGSSTLTCGYSPFLNKYIGLFLITILDMERYRYSFGRKYGKEQIKGASIKLPVTKDGNPDWDFMEYYMKSLPYSTNIKEHKQSSKNRLSDEDLVNKYESGAIDLGKKLKKAIEKS